MKFDIQSRIDDLYSEGNRFRVGRMIPKNVSDEFLVWLNECPVQWRLITQKKDSLTYCFDKKVEE